MNGKHLLVNGKNVSADVDDESLWREVFDKTVSTTKTTKMRDFDLVKFPEKGVTAFLVLGFASSFCNAFFTSSANLGAFFLAKILM